MSREHERNGALEAIDRILNRGEDADEVLRNVVRVLARLYAYVGLDFVDEEELLTGPELGVREQESTRRFPIVYEGVHAGDLVIASALPEDEPFLQRVAVLISAHVLIGWDTGGQVWQP